jgi:hypothetical protein
VELAETAKIRESAKKTWYSGGVGLSLGFVPPLPMPIRAFQRGTQRCAGKRTVNEMTLDISFVHRSIEILSLCLDYEFTRQSTITTSY